MGEAKDGCVKPAKGPIGLLGNQNLSTYTNSKGGKKMSVQVGKQAPDFTAKAYHEGMAKEYQAFRLSRQVGDALLLPCRFHLRLTDGSVGSCRQISGISKLGVEVLSVSVDSVYSHKVWQEVELSKMVGSGVPYPMLSDPGGKIGTLYGVYDEGKGVDVRGRFLIDPDGSNPGHGSDDHTSRTQHRGSFTSIEGFPAPSENR